MDNQEWDAGSVRALRHHLRISQQALARELGVRQQTVSEWETGLYRPRGASGRGLAIVAERAGFQYDPSPPDPRRLLPPPGGRAPGKED